MFYFKRPKIFIFKYLFRSAILSASSIWTSHKNTKPWDIHIILCTNNLQNVHADSTENILWMTHHRPTKNETMFLYTEVIEIGTYVCMNR